MLEHSGAETIPGGSLVAMERFLSATNAATNARYRARTERQPVSPTVVALLPARRTRHMERFFPSTCAPSETTVATAGQLQSAACIARCYKFVGSEPVATADFGITSRTSGTRMESAAAVLSTIAVTAKVAYDC